jgi:hypothetical protein
VTFDAALSLLEISFTSPRGLVYFADKSTRMSFMSDLREYYLNKYILEGMTLSEWWVMAQELCLPIKKAVKKENMIRCFMQDEYETRELACLGVRSGTMRFLYSSKGKAFIIQAAVNQNVKLDGGVIMQNDAGKTMKISFSDMPEVI